ncbi:MULTISPECIES: BolA/IbaG family iron-sulfur metabolism protein [unclassified Rickettsia]|uniref:BolA/IbaG family iron-sulfur metabolism protein n=1 Tax=unclassified Rickettsia TaxID=114295 RepID=UPI00209DCD63|nr:BolA family transcriptional regulator [Rickettsia endosymbiont of Ceutorhynchus assimilis]
MAISIEELEKVLRETFPDSIIKITDLVGDQDHYAVEISDSKFKGLTLINQHKLVKNALREILNTKLHAITIKTIVC